MQRFLVVYHGILPLLFFILECVYQETDTRDACHITHVIGEGCEGGVLIPFRRKLFFSNTSSNPTIPACVAQIEIPFPIFLLFFFQESQYQCTKSHFPASTKGKSQFPFYPFTTLHFVLLVKRVLLLDVFTLVDRFTVFQVLMKMSFIFRLNVRDCRANVIFYCNFYQ